MARLIRATVVTVMLAGCVSLTPEAERVRMVRNPNDVLSCTKLGGLESTSWAWGGFAAAAGLENNKADIQNRTAALGGDTVLLLQERATYLAPHTYGEAYRCAGATPSKPIGGTEAPPWCRGEKDTWDGHRCMTRN